MATPRRTAKAQDTVKVEPASASQPRPGPTTPSTEEVDAALEQSAEFLQQQEEPPTDVHPKPTTPTAAEVDSALEQSAEFLESQGVTTNVTTTDAAPVSAGTATPSLDAAPVYGGRDKTQDAAPVFSAPTPDRPAEE